MAKRDGWSVFKTPSGNLVLLEGDDSNRPGLTFLAWTAGHKSDGKALLREMIDAGKGAAR